MSGAGLDSFDVVRTGRDVDQVCDAGDIEVLRELILLGGGRDGDAEPGIAYAPQQVGDRGEGTHQRQIFALEALAAPFLHLLAVVALRVGREEVRNQLVAAFADLAPRLLEADVVTELHHGFVPGESVEIDRVEKRPVDVEDGGFWHSGSSGAGPP